MQKGRILTMKYAPPNLYRITFDAWSSGNCCDGAATRMSPSCVSGPEAAGLGGCVQGAAAENPCKVGAAAGTDCNSGAGFGEWDPDENTN
jgi:hypothetical protein